MLFCENDYNIGQGVITIKIIEKVITSRLQLSLLFLLIRTYKRREFISLLK